VQRNILEDPARGYLANDTIIIKYTIELVVSTGGALSRNQHPNKGDLIRAPLPTLGRDLGELFRTGGCVAKDLTDSHCISAGKSRMFCGVSVVMF
jgi:speckle-type POZ protein